MKYTHLFENCPFAFNQFDKLHIIKKYNYWIENLRNKNVIRRLNKQKNSVKWVKFYE